MFGRFAAQSAVAVVLFLLAEIVTSPTAHAQYQINVVGALSPAPELREQSSTLAEPFGVATMPVIAGGVVDKWNGVVADIGQESEVLARCRDNTKPCPPAAQKFLAVVAEGRAHAGRARIGVINRAINLAIRPTSDLAQWGVEDRWSSPLVTLGSGRGDCEDYAIAKYVALREAGVDENDVRLVIVRDLASGNDHAVVTTRIDDKWIVLDNRRLTLVEDVEMPRVRPLFVLDHAGVKQFAATEIANAETARPSAFGN
jgi:predicted transglutaminase-like cysteine proteinase